MENEYNREILLQFLLGLQWKYWTADAHKFHQISAQSLKLVRKTQNKI